MKQRRPHLSLNKIEAAFLKLGIDPSATDEEVKAAYRKLSKKYHPDTGNEKADDQKKLNEAYELALQVSKSGTGLMLTETFRSLEEISRFEKSQRARNDLNRIAERQQRERASSYKNYRNISVGIAAFAALIALAGSSLFPSLEDINKDLYKQLKPVLGIVTFIAGAIAVVFQNKATTSQHKIDDYLEYISDIKHCAKELAGFLEYKDLTFFDEHKILKLNRRNTEPNYKDRRNIKLLILKAQDHGLIERIEDDNLTPSTIAKYQISKTFKASSFR